MRTDLHACAALLVVLSVGAALADDYQCSDPLLTARARTAEVGNMVCTAATAAKALLVSCGLTQTYPISIDVVDTAQHPTFGDCLALYDQRTGCLQVTDPDRLPSVLPQGDPRAAMPPQVLFSAAITHEMAHALLQQSAGERQIAATEQEFVANAFEMQSLAPEWRDLLLPSHPVTPPGSLGLVHLSIYALDPRTFANNAWMVFDQEVMGCALVRNIAEGKFRFPPPQGALQGTIPDRHINVEIETASNLTLGMTVADWWHVTKREPNAMFRHSPSGLPLDGKVA